LHLDCKFSEKNKVHHMAEQSRKKI
jgi:hypothetical protein